MRRIGLQAVLDLSSWSKNVQTFYDDTGRMISMTQKASLNTRSFSLGVTQALSGAGRAIGTFGATLAALVANRALDAITDKIRDIGSEAIKAAEDFQVLRVRFQTLMARDYSNKFGVSMEAAYKKVGSMAEDTLMWVRKIAVTTPFSVDSISNVLAMGQAYGFTIDQAKRLALGIGNFTAGMGLSDEIMKRIMYNVGQIMAAGRVYGTELRDLARDFVPVTRIIENMAQASNRTFNEIKQDLSDGKISGQAFVKAFLEMAEKDFPNAMAKLSATMMFAKQNIHDFIQTAIGMDVLGPTFDALATKLSGFLAGMFDESVQRGFITVGYSLRNSLGLISSAVTKDLLPALRDLAATFGFTGFSAGNFSNIMLNVGAAIGFFISLVSKAIEGVSNFIKGILSRFGTSFQQIATNMAHWGANVVLSFARGMIAGVYAIINVIKQITSILTYWLQSNSPPRILPDLDKWGQAAMQSYIDGWQNADFTKFTDIADTVENFVRSLRGISFEELDIVPRILGSRNAISDAIDMVKRSGNATREMFQGILSSAGLSEQRIVDYVYSLYQHEKASKAVAEAQEEINRVTQIYDDKLESLRRQQQKLDDAQEDSGRLKQIDFALNKIILTDEERNRLQLEKKGILLNRQIRDTEAEKDAVVKSANAKLDAAKALEESAKLEMENRKIAVEMMIKQNQLIQEQIDLIESLKEKEKKGGENPADQIDDMLEGIGGMGDGSGMSDIRKQIEEQVNALTESIRLKFEEMKTSLLGVFQPVVDEWTNNVFPQLTALWTEFRKKMDEFSNSAEVQNLRIRLSNAWIVIKNKFNETKSTILTGFDVLRDTIDERTKEIQKNLESIFGKKDWNKELELTIRDLTDLVTIVLDIIAIVLGVVAGIIAGIGLAVSRVTEYIDKTKKFFAQYRDVWLNIWKMFSEGNILGGILEAIFAIIAGILGLLLWGFGLVLAVVSGFIEGFIQFFIDLWNRLVKHSIIPDMWADIQRVFTEKPAEILAAIKKWIDDLIASFDKKRQEFVDAVSTTWTNISTAVSEKTSEILENVNTWLQKQIGLMQENWETFKTNASLLWTQVKDAIDEKIKLALDAVDKWLQDQIDKMQEKWKDFWKAAGDLWEQVKTGISESMARILAAIEQWFTDLLTKTFPGWYKSLYSAGSDLFNQFKDGVMEVVNGIPGAVQGALAGLGSYLDGLLTKAKELLHFKTPSNPGLPPDRPKARGANLRVPGGYNNDNYRVGLTSGERLIVIPRSVQNMLASNPMMTSSYLTSLYNNVGSSVRSALRTNFATAPSGGNVYIDRRVSISMNPSYANVQSPSSIYYDITAALTTVGI